MPQYLRILSFRCPVFSANGVFDAEVGLTPIPRETSMLKQTKYRMISAALPLLLAVASPGADAATPDANGVISACYSNNGSIRVIDPAASEQCRSKETLLEWNQAGPSGSPGSMGPPGPSGPPGSSEAYVASGSGPLFFSNAQGMVTVATLNLPVGNYVLNAKVLVGNSSSSDDAAEINCGLRYGFGGSGAIDVTSAARLFKGAPYAAGSMTTLPLSGSIVIATGDENPVVLNCVTTSDASFAQFGKLNAIAVSTLYVQ